MEAHAKKIVDFLKTRDVRFIIPVYQRNYDWTTKHCARLLKDILDIGNNEKSKAHFIGSIVYVHDGTYTTTSIKELTIIDGQQRLTTITLIYLALYHLAKSMGEKKRADTIKETYLMSKDEDKEIEELKLCTTDNNDRALKSLLQDDGHKDFTLYSNLIVNFDYFKTSITEENYEKVRLGLSKLMFVEISLDRNNDDPQRIFESLNSTGLDLSQADLIRNYILMGLNRKDQNKIYQNYWEAIETFAKDETLNVSKVDAFIRDFLTLENKKIPNIRNVYNEFKGRYHSSTVEELEGTMSQIKRLAIHYNKLLNPQKEIDVEIQRQLKYICQIEINVAYPFLMKVYDDFSSNIIDKTTFINILDLVQSFTWRRFIVGLPTNALNKIFMSLYDKVDTNNYLYSIQKSLLQRSGIQRFPKDEEVAKSLKEKDVYNIRHQNAMYFLERLENYQNPEQVIFDDNITIEHIFPRNPDPKWRMELSANEYNNIKENYLNTIGNLTLSGNNGKLGNKSFIEKRDMNIDGKEQGYSHSRFWLNKCLSKKMTWNLHEIEERTNMITERVIKIWEYPNIQIESDNENDEVDIFEADDPTDKKLEYYVFLDQRVDVSNVSHMFKTIFKQLFDLQPDTFFNSTIKDRISISNNPDTYGNRSYERLNDTYFMCTNYSSIEKIERIKEALRIFKLEDELSIKYAKNK